VIDLGAGKIDVSLMYIEDDIIEVLRFLSLFFSFFWFSTIIVLICRSMRLQVILIWVVLILV
jgi:hypothetical protein